MALEKALSMEQVKSKLKNLREIMPEQPEIIYDFASYLADRISDELVPEGFYTISQLVLYDLKNGISTFSDVPIPNKLTGYSIPIYASLSPHITSIAEAVCPPEFAKGVKRMDKAVQDYIKKNPKWCRS
ncbi:Uncharacterised protein [uncultured archaeon]|nr:Uncharacterised protein [uncultured archaeon]